MGQTGKSVKYLETIIKKGVKVDGNCKYWINNQVLLTDAFQFFMDKFSNIHVLKIKCGNSLLKLAGKMRESVEKIQSKNYNDIIGLKFWD